MTHYLELFAPPWYLRNGHVQTILTGFYRPKPTLPEPITYQVPIGEDGHCLIYENRPLKEKTSTQATSMASSGPGKDDSAVMLLHGLGSSHSGTYMTSISEELLRVGERVFRVDLPGAGPSARFTPLPPHGACFEQVWTMLKWVRDNLGIRRWRIGGVSLGGNILLRMLATKRSSIDTGDGSRELSVLKAVAVAPPIRLADCSAHMESGLHQIYARYFLRALKKQATERAKIWPQWKQQMQHARFETIRRFDETVTAPLAGFRDAEEYYATGSSAALLDQIEVSTSVLIDDHDPIVPAWMFDNVHWSPSTRLYRTNHGGHVGYLERQRGVYRRWADHWIAKELLEQNEDSIS